MSFDIIKNYLRNRMEGLGYSESKEPVSFDNASVNEFQKTFILNRDNGQKLEDGSDRLNTEFIDFQEWSIKIAFPRSEHNDLINRDDMQRSLEAILKDLDNPSNFLGTVRYISYQSWEMEEFDNYFLLTIRIQVQDRITY